MVQNISICDLLNQPDKKISFWVDRFEDMPEPEKLVCPHKHNFYEIIWVKKGNGTQTIDYKYYEITDDSLFFISPGQLHLFEEWQDIEGYCIMFTESYFLQLFQNKNILFELSYVDNLYLNPFLKIEEEGKSKLHAVVDLLLEENSNETIQALLFVFLKQIQNLFSKKVIDQNSKHQIVVFKQFKSLVDQNFNKNLVLKEYANQLNITAHYLNSTVKTICNKTASDIIRERILVEAKQLLQFSDDTITQICDKLGFKDSSYFARYFKKATSSSPLDFRKNLR